MSNTQGTRLAAVMADHDKGPEYALVECIGDDFSCTAKQRIEDSWGKSDEQITGELAALGWSVSPTLCPEHQHERIQPRTGDQWPMFALVSDRLGTFSGIHPHASITKLYGGDPQPVTVTVDPDGEYLGWIDRTNKHDGTPPDGVPIMIEHKQIFSIQFPYGVKAEVEKQEGFVVPLRIDLA